MTPYDYQPPGFKEGGNSHFLLFDGEPVSLRMGSVSSGFHSMKVKVTTEATRMLDGENSPTQETGTTEIAHQGLDCDEEEEDGSNQVRPSFSDPSLLHLNTVDIFQCVFRSCHSNRVQRSMAYMKTETKLASDVKDFLVKKKKKVFQEEIHVSYCLAIRKKSQCALFFKGTYVFILFFFHISKVTYF